MKQTITIIFFFILSFTNINAQTNLVSNGDFESYSSLPTNISQWNFVVGWNNTGGSGTPDYYNQLSFSVYGSIPPISGNGQMGFLTYVSTGGIWREYISTQFISSMTKGVKYKVSFYLTNGFGYAASSTKGSNNFGICFSKNNLHQIASNPISVTPQIEIDTIIYFYNYWQHYIINYTATDTFKYLTIGNFKDDAHTLISTFGNFDAYYFIDKIEIIPLLTIKGDSVICSGNPVTLQTYGDSIVKWKSTLNPNIIIATDSFITVSPTVTTTYFAYTDYDTAYFTVNVVNPPVINLGNDTVLCQGQTLTLNAKTKFATYLWQDGSTDTSYNVNQQGTYWVKVTIDSNCVTRDSIKVNYIGAPSLSAISDTSLCKGIPFIISIPTGTYSILWNNGDTNCIRYFNQSGLYNITLTNQCGISSDSFKLDFIDCNVDLIIPNIFTPNGDGYNDYFFIKNFEYWNIDLQIFNRWGAIVYQNNTYKNTWDGKDVSDGVYFYVIKATNSINGVEKQYKGSLTVLR